MIFLFGGSFPISRERRKTFCLREGNSSETVRFRILFRGFFSWWLLAPNTPSAGPKALHPSPKFEISASHFFPALAGQRANRMVRPLHSLLLFFPRQCGFAEKDEGVQGENLRLAPWSTGVETLSGAKIEFLRRVQGLRSCRGVLGARSHQPSPEPESGNSPPPI